MLRRTRRKLQWGFNVPEGGGMDWNRLENEHAWFCMFPTAFEAEDGGPDDPC